MRCRVIPATLPACQGAPASRRAFSTPGSRAERLSFFAWGRVHAGACAQDVTCAIHVWFSGLVILAPTPSFPLPRLEAAIRLPLWIRGRGKGSFGGKGAAKPPPSLRKIIPPLHLELFQALRGRSAERGAMGVRPRDVPPTKPIACGGKVIRCAGAPHPGPTRRIFSEHALRGRAGTGVQSGLPPGAGVAR
jgi:hypothetical protein